LETPPQNQLGRALPYIALVWEVGFALAVPMIAGAVLGLWIDRSIGSGPVLSLVGLFAGMAAGGFTTYRLVIRFLARFADEPPPEGRDGADGRDGDGPRGARTPRSW
jgi:hypothetical protein